MKRSLAVILPVFFVVCGCHKEPPPPPPPPVPVAVYPASMGKVTRQVTVIGSIRAFASVDLVARVSGYLLERNFREGQFVRKGDLLYLIEPYQYDAAVKVAAGNLGVSISTQKNAEITMLRQKELVERGATSVQNYDNALASKIEADSNVEAMRGQLEQARLNLSYTKVLAPFDGWMGLNKYDVGNLVGPSSGVLATIVDQSRVLVQFSPADTDIRMLGEYLNSKTQFSGLLVHLFYESGEMYSEPGVIVRNDNQIDPSTATATLLAIFPNPEGKLAQGQFVTLRIETEEQDELLLVPRVAMLSDQQGDYVWVAGKDNKAQRRNLVVTKEFDHFSAISQGAGAGDRIIVDNLAKMRIGTAVAAHDAAKLNDQFMALAGGQPVKIPAIDRDKTYLRQSDTAGRGISGEIEKSAKATGEGLDFRTPPWKTTDPIDPTGTPAGQPKESR